MVKVPSAYDFTGEVTFSRYFQIAPEDFDKYQFHIVMLGSNYNTSVTINGDFIANHIGGYTSFVAPIPSNVLQVGKENLIKITTDNRLDATKTIPLRSQVWGWKNYGGILRDVYILGTPKVFISDVVISTETNTPFTSARLKATITLDGMSPSAVDSLTGRYKVFAELYDKQTSELVATSQTVGITGKGRQWDTARVDLAIAAPRLWSPETPDLYFLKTVLLEAGAPVDQYIVNTGIRKIETANHRLLLNGKPLFLKGTIWMEDHPAYGGALTSDQMERDVVMIKNAGANAIRFGYHPPHPYMLNLCDRYGLLALEELPVRGVPASILSGENYIELATARLHEMIVRDRNHPSVFAWGLGEEFESSSPAAREYVAPLVALAKSLDNRFVYYASRHLTNDACSNLVDLRAAVLLTRDVRTFQAELGKLQAADSTKPVILVKMGCEVQPNNNNGYSDPLSHQAQARFMMQHIDAVKSSSVDGVFIWTFNDWRGDRPALSVNSGDPWLHTAGIVTYAREKRLAYDAVRTAFNGERFVSLPIGSNSSAAPIIYVLSGLVLLVGTAYIYNANRRFRESLNRSVVNAYNFFSDVRDQRIVTIFHSTLLGLIVSAAAAIVLSSFLYRFRGNLMLDNLLSYVLVSDTVKEVVVRLVLNPMKFLGACTGAIFLCLLALSLLVWAVAPLFKARIYLYHAYAITIWSTPPFLILIPMGMILYRLLENEVYVLPAIILCVLLCVWVFTRFLKGLSIILDVYPLKVYALGFVSIIGICVGAYLYLDHTQATSVYLKFLYHDMVGR